MPPAVLSAEPPARCITVGGGGTAGYAPDHRDFLKSVPPDVARLDLWCRPDGGGRQETLDAL